MTKRVPTASRPRPSFRGRNGVKRVPKCVPVPIKGRTGRGTRQAQDDPQNGLADTPPGRVWGRALAGLLPQGSLMGHNL